MKSIEEDSVPETMESNKSHENEGKGDDFYFYFLTLSFYQIIVTNLAFLYVSDWIIFIQVHKIRSRQLRYLLKFKILIILDAKSTGGMMPRISSSASFKNAYLNRHVFLRDSLLTNGGISKKSAKWVFLRTDPFSCTQGDFFRK